MKEKTTVSERNSGRTTEKKPQNIVNETNL